MAALRHLKQQVATLAKIASRLRQIGLGKIMFGSDATASYPSSIADAWANFRRVPMTEDEFSQIARNEAPYLQ
ncbi:hypothetical protein OMW55_01575 [Sphingomonas sp. BN140010]|uniref:Amidohydrolase-related domain-containing protein n=1 Tax=Sphingomonas arvum TaxID=2992113 RepID=A0ABT3JBQ8_9SPHN|nr:hypothetical protein [Sphingomonas sp. BN140010]MCW3796500.1 hypothetical protein [Sphingomonas sp. BN140010]